MANDLSAIQHSTQNESKHNAELSVDPQANKFCMGMTVYKRDTGMAFEVVNVSQSNGIRHYNCSVRKQGHATICQNMLLNKTIPAQILNLTN